MEHSFVRSLTPEEQELENKLAELEQLESEFSQIELGLATFRAEMTAFDLKYNQIVGVRLAQLDNIGAQIAEILAKMSPGDEEAAHEAKRARQKARASATAAGPTRSPCPFDSGFVASEELKALFREAAKKCHPDLAVDENERHRRTKVMAEINAAFMVGDAERLRSILADWTASPENVRGDDVASKLVRVIRKIAQGRKRLDSAKLELDQLKQTDIYQLMVRATEAAKEQRDLLHEMSQAIVSRIHEQQRRLDDLMDVFTHSREGAPTNE
jgi:hypothetical protein